MRSEEEAPAQRGGTSHARTSISGFDARPLRRRALLLVVGF